MHGYAIQRSVRQSLLMSGGEAGIFLERPISAALLAVAVAFVLFNAWSGRRRRRSLDQSVQA